jgi:hypothetical protein
MLLVTFGPTVGWAGETITFENEQFTLGGHGVISASATSPSSGTDLAQILMLYVRFWIGVWYVLERLFWSQPVGGE